MSDGDSALCQRSPTGHAARYHPRSPAPTFRVSRGRCYERLTHARRSTCDARGDGRRVSISKAAEQSAGLRRLPVEAEPDDRREEVKAKLTSVEQKYERRSGPAEHVFPEEHGERH